MKKLKRLASMLMILAVLFSANIGAAAKGIPQDADDIQNTIEQFFTIYMDGLKNEMHPDISSVTVQNANTLLYNEMMNYEVDASIIFDSCYESYSFTLDIHDMDITGDTATVELDIVSEIHFKELSSTTLRSIPYVFVLEKLENVWEINYIDTSYIVFAAFADALPANDNENTIVEQARTLSDAYVGDMKTMDASKLQLIRSGDPMSEESQRKLADMKAAEFAETAKGTASILSTSVSYDRYVAVAYADTYSGKNGSTYNPLFYKATSTTIDENGNPKIINEDCTNFVSQCVWAGYGGWDSGSTTNTKNNITNHYRMYYTGGSNWYGTDWFANTGGGSGAWEGVSNHWNFVTGNPAIGAKGSGYNNGSKYTNLSAGAIGVGETLQFRNSAKSSTYQHSIFVTHLETNFPNPITYNMVLCNAHNVDYYREPLTTWIIAFGGSGSTCYMRDILYTTANFSS